MVAAAAGRWCGGRSGEGVKEARIWAELGSGSTTLNKLNCNFKPHYAKFSTKNHLVQSASELQGITKLHFNILFFLFSRGLAVTPS